MTFFWVELRRKDQSLSVDILCEACRAKAPELQQPLTDREKANGYDYRVRPYTAGDQKCFDCRRQPDESAAKGAA